MNYFSSGLEEPESSESDESEEGSSLCANLFQSSGLMFADVGGVEFAEDVESFDNRLVATRAGEVFRSKGTLTVIAAICASDGSGSVVGLTNGGTRCNTIAGLAAGGATNVHGCRQLTEVWPN